MIPSSKVSHERVRECLNAGSKDFIIKPFNLPVLVQRAVRLIGKRCKAPIRCRLSEAAV
ncbi:MAG: hypothetical protein HYZ11_08600 [Candidatus Tectomicrobia bacterium]|uniref:Response regulatory domain-containing protein n=1 Tax=Tectimicrobiota bacterium TaxID=2528274 RepID=A0A932MQ06_UNCTE|nr:hypothetical protein [Candidatus Tectomicrobia bacterium]